MNIIIEYRGKISNDIDFKEAAKRDLCSDVILKDVFISCGCNIIRIYPMKKADT